MLIIIDPDRVMIEGQAVIRPSSISPSEWLEFWERAALMTSCHYSTLRRAVAIMRGDPYDR